MPGFGDGPRFFNFTPCCNFSKKMDTTKPVSDIMTRNLIVVKPEDTIDRVHDLFEKNHFHHIPVVDHHKLVGIVSKTDYLKIRHMLATTWSGETICQDMYKDMCAGDIMSREPLKLEPGDSIGLAADIFRANALHALPIVDDGELVGIVTSHDLLTYAYQGSL
jgi:acetoin utilization protein AcuB